MGITTSGLLSELFTKRFAKRSGKGKSYTRRKKKKRK